MLVIKAEEECCLERGLQPLAGRNHACDQRDP